MAKVILSDPTVRLRGTFAGYVFSIRYGKQFMNAQIPHKCKSNARAEEKNKVRRHNILNEAVALIQEHYYDEVKGSGDAKKALQVVQLQIANYENYRAYAGRKYDEWHEKTKSDGKLVYAIFNAYVYKYEPSFAKKKSKK